jgi:ATP-dependent DNA ligase
MARSTRTNPHHLEDQLQYHVFDIVDTTSTLSQDERFEILDQLPSSSRVINAERSVIYSLEEMSNFYSYFADQTFEGVILRSRDCIYINKRSLQLRKYKEFMDEEFEIVGVYHDPGVDRTQFSWKCVMKDGTEFKAKPTGSEAEKRIWYDNQDDYIGEMLTVRYQELSDDGIPRFPRGIEIRNYE